MATEKVENSTEKKLDIKKFIATKKKILISVLIVVVILAGAFFLKGLFVVALVNNQPISRFTLDRELEKQGGKQVLENKISEMLIFNEANKQKVTVTQAEIDAKLKQIEDQVTAQGQKLDDLLAQQGQTRVELQSQIKIQILVEKMVGKDIQITDKEISDYFTTNSSTYPKGTKLEDKKADIQKTLYQQKLSAAFQPWLDNIRKSASIRYFVQF